jgi:predicted transcriptional regulator
LNKIELLRKANVEHWDELTPEQQAEIEEAFTELNKGNGVGHEEVMSKLRKR